MTSLRKRKKAIGQMQGAMTCLKSDDDGLWENTRPVGREFGSPDFERLMAEDYRNGAGVFDPALKARFRVCIDIPEDQAVQERTAFPT